MRTPRYLFERDQFIEVLWGVLDAFVGEEDGQSFREVDRDLPLFEPGSD